MVKKEKEKKRNDFFSFTKSIKAFQVFFCPPSSFFNALATFKVPIKAKVKEAFCLLG